MRLNHESVPQDSPCDAPCGHIRMAGRSAGRCARPVVGVARSVCWPHERGNVTVLPPTPGRNPLHGVLAADQTTAAEPADVETIRGATTAVSGRDVDETDLASYMAEAGRILG